MRMILLVVFALAGQSVGAQSFNPQRDVPLSRDLGCVAAEQWQNDTTPPEWARVVRACVTQERMADAIAAFWVYNSYILFDQQRVRDESAHVVKSELNAWVFAGFSRAQIDALKVWVDRMRGPGHAFHARTCGALSALGPPDYRPAYMIVRGMIPRKNETDWQVAGFDPNAAWRVAIEDENGCAPL